MMFHAAKSGHENFSESTEVFYSSPPSQVNVLHNFSFLLQVIAALTPEERAQKALELRDRIRAARAIKEEQEKKEQAGTFGVLHTPLKVF